MYARARTKKAILLKYSLIFLNYSLLKASTGSFLAAILAGTNPETRVNNILITIITIALLIGRDAIV